PADLPSCTAARVRSSGGAVLRSGRVRRRGVGRRPLLRYCGFRRCLRSETLLTDRTAIVLLTSVLLARILLTSVLLARILLTSVLLARAIACGGPSSTLLRI